VDADVLQLRILFGEEPFEEENWDYDDVFDVSMLFSENDN